MCIVIDKPAMEFRIKDEEESEFYKGLVFEMVPEMLTIGHVMNEARVRLIEERANFSRFLILPTKLNFIKEVRILSNNQSQEMQDGDE